jgi:hypothetical protein
VGLVVLFGGCGCAEVPTVTAPPAAGVLFKRIVTFWPACTWLPMSMRFQLNKSDKDTEYFWAMVVKLSPVSTVWLISA